MLKKNRSVNRDRRSFLFFGYSFIAAALFFWQEHFFRPDLQNKNDLLFVKSVFVGRHFVDGARGYHYIWLRHYKIPFKIEPEYLHVLRYRTFNKISIGDTLTVGIARYDSSQLAGSGDFVLAYSIEGNDRIYLDAGEALAIYNRPRTYYLSGFFILMSGGFLYFGYRMKKNERTAI